MAGDKASTSGRRQYLIEKYLNNTCTREELDELLAEVESDSGREILLEAFQQYWNNAAETASTPEPAWGERFDRMMEDIHHMEPKPVRFLRRWQVAAAIAVLLGGAALWLLLNSPGHQDKVIYASTSQSKKDSIQPGGNKAILILANGTAIGLDSAGNGILARQGNTKIVKTGIGQLAYNAARNGPEKILYNTIVTPRGGRYQVVLSDDTKVWLNAGSSLKFPTRFMGKERQVELRGEGYFEVATNETMPFTVRVNNMKVAVLGTKFNVMAYDDENTINTTLLAGAVSITAAQHEVLLRPGQQATLSRGSGQMKVVKAAENVIAWKNGLFQFNDTDLETIMRQIARWYDVEISYQGDIPDRKFTGTIPRTVSLSHVLKVLTLSNIHFKVTGKKIIVTP